MTVFRHLLTATLVLVACSTGRAENAARPAPALPPTATPAAMVTANLVAGHFRLATANGKAVDSDGLEGTPYGLFFGFTHCPDICPTTLATLSIAIGQLPPAVRDLRVYFISVDPERDTPEALDQYMSSFDPRIVALTGERPAVDEAIATFGVVARRVPTSGGDYTFEHTASVFLVDGDGLIVDRVAADAGPEVLAGKLASLAARSQPKPAAR